MATRDRKRPKKPPVHDQAFFLALARPHDDSEAAWDEARERWNAWRRDPANAEVDVTFEGVDFRTEENRGISFAGFEFGYRARFVGATFGVGASFGGATFGDGAQFGGATFGVYARFDGATFGDLAWFDGATFGIGARFDGATFGDEARFDGAMFGDRTRFDDATFGVWAWLAGARFGDRAQFAGATFGYGARFAGATFGARARFDGATGEGDVEARRKGWRELEETERARREKDYRDLRESEGFGPAKFSNLAFSGAHFRGSVSFARRSFERPTDFTGVRFDAPPDFDGATNLQRIDFTGARVGFVVDDRPWWRPDWTTDSRVAIRLRALRSQIEATKNHDFERDLSIEERKAERGIHLDRLWRQLRLRRSAAIARAFLGSLPRLPRVDVFAGRGEPVVAWPAPRPNRRESQRPAFVDRASPAARRLRRAYRRHAVRMLTAAGALAVHLAWIAVMAVYWLLADYGRSWMRPAVWLVVVVALFHGVGPVDGVTARALSETRDRIVAAAEAARPGRGAEVGERWDAAAGLYAVANSIPFVGPLTIDGEVKKFLFCGEPPPAPAPGAAGPLPCVPLPPARLQVATIAQNLLSLLLVFFIGLALRNYFRVK